MSTTRKNGAFRVVPDGAARGRARGAGRSGPPALPAGRDRVDPGDALERLFEATSLMHVAEEHERAVEAGRPASSDVPSTEALGWRIKRARRALSPAVRGEATRALAVLDGFLRSMAREARTLGTYRDALPVAARLGIVGASILREERPRTTFELTSAITLAFWQTQAERDVAVLAATPPGYRAEVQAPGKADAGGKVTQSSTADYSERHRLAMSSTTQARQERIAFGDLLLSRAKGRREGLVTDAAGEDALAERLEEMIRKQDEAAAQGRRLLAMGIPGTTSPTPAASVEAQPAAAPVATHASVAERAQANVEAAAPVRTTSDPSPKLVYEVARPGVPVRPAWWAPAPAAIDHFADLRRIHADPEALAQACAGRVAEWRTKAQIAADQGIAKRYVGPRAIPAFVASWMRRAGRAAELQHMVARLGFAEEAT